MASWNYRYAIETKAQRACKRKPPNMLNVCVHVYEQEWVNATERKWGADKTEMRWGEVETLM